MLRGAPSKTSRARTAKAPSKARGAHAQTASRARTSRTSFKPRTQRRAAHPFIVALIIVGIIGFLLYNLVSCATRPLFDVQTSSSKESALEQVYTSPFDWTALSFDSAGLPHYTLEGEDISHIGIDVSANQGVIDWNAVAGDGIEFAMIRVAYRGTTEGGLYEDEYAQQNIASATNAGLKIGAYVFSQATNATEAREEAQMAIDALDGYRIDYPVVFDLELVEGTGRTASLTRDELTEIAQSFCETVSAAGYTPMLYGNTIDLHRIDPSLRARYPIWFAQYNEQPEARFDFGIWQYSHTGSVSGIATPVDMNIDVSEVLARHYENLNYRLGNWNLSKST